MSLPTKPIIRHKVVVAATLAAAVLLAGPVAGAAASAPHSVSAQQIVTSASISIAPRTSGLSASQRQAALAAQSYLRSGIGFSNLSLLGQLTSKYGNGFSKKDAAAAIKSLKPNWKAQAVLAAKGYMKSGIGFSRSSLQSQLTSRYGNRFTKAQAKYAVAKVGL